MLFLTVLTFSAVITVWVSSSRDVLQCVVDMLFYFVYSVPLLP